ncbi:MAG: hypothetical protein ACI39W_10225 [Brotaphodocola sp.]
MGEEGRKERSVCDRASTMIVFLQGQDEYGLYGQICNGYLAEPMAFYGAGDLILKIDTICDWIGTPHRSAEPRMMNLDMWQQFQKRQEHHPEVCANCLQRNLNVDTGAEAALAIETVVVCVEFRQHASLQGRVIGKLTNDQSVSFRSALELMRMFEEIRFCWKSSDAEQQQEWAGN